MGNRTLLSLEENEVATFLGIEADKIVWDISICVVVCCLLSLCLFKVCECFFARRRRKQLQTKQIEQRLLAHPENANERNLDDMPQQTSSTPHSHSPLLMGSQNAQTNDGYEPGTTNTNAIANMNMS